jgi:two-component system, chemotaxis family, CheB/CheR fusion protein
MAQQPRISQLVVVGASAGGVEALSTLVATLPPEFPAPLVIAQHLDPGRPSHLAEILARRSTLPVQQVVDHAPLENGVVYVVPANRHVEITDHAISLRTRDGSRSMPSVDLLLTTAAPVFGENLIAVILTGTGSDGAAGARAVKEAGGMVVIQNPHTAQFGAMPAAIAPPLVDVVADLEAIGALLHDLLTGAYTPAAPAENRTLDALLDQLHEASGIDFSQYKMPTIQRRVQRRMAATGMRRLADYRDYLQSYPEEYQRLVGTFLIKVTEFFRDPELFAYLREQVLPEIVAAARGRDQEIRLWSAGCATGEEAYSLAILLAEVLGEELERFTVRLFATDLDAAAIAYARRGVYPANALATLPRDLVEQYFLPLNGGYEVSKRVRSLVIFGEHDLGQRAPFPHIDLCLCRNVLIYFTPQLQERALQLFAFGLRDGGYLVLGKSETPGPLAEFFVPAHPQLKIYRRQGDRMLIPAARIKDTTPLRLVHNRVDSRTPGRPAAQTVRGAPRPWTSTDDEAALLRALPWGALVIDRHYDIQTINPAARRLLGIHGPELGEDLLHLTERLPAPGLRVAIDAVRGGAAERELLLAVETAQGEQRYLQLICRPQTRTGEAVEQGPAPAEGTVLILVADVTALEGARRAEAETLARVQEEQARLEDRLRQTVELNRELEAANEQLSAANAELRSANEEFLVGSEETQAAMEEIETLNEELQATNEELETLNEELQATVEELHTTNDDLQARNLEMQALAAEREEQRQRSEAERARLAAVLLSMGDAVLVVDRTGAVVLTNAAVERLLGPGGADVVPQDADGQPLPAEQTPRARAARGETFSMTFTLPGSDAARRWFEATGQPIQSEGMDQGSVVVIRDITERSLRRMQEEYLVLISHELRTPLTPIHGYLTLLSRLLRTESTDGRAQRYLARVQEQMQRLQRLVDDLLEVERLQEGKLRLERDAVNLVPLVQGLVEALQATMDGPRVELAMAEGPLVVAGDAARLSQVVLNLLTNAAKYAADSERIDVRLRREEGAALLEVQDYGPGIPAAALPHLFDRFYQVVQRTAQDGLGVGLFITRELVRAHGGAIEVRSTEGEGATFTVRLPLLTAPAEAGPTSTPDAKEPP